MLTSRLRHRALAIALATIMVAVAVALAATPAFADTVLDVYPDSYTPKNPVQDNITRLNVNKLEKGARDYVEGAHLAIYEKETGKLITEWISDGSVHEVARNANGKNQGALDVNTVYILRELSAPEGYAKAKDVEFVIRSDENFNTAGEILSGGENGNADSEQIRGSGPEQAFVINLYDEATVNVTDEERRTRQREQELEQQQEEQRERERTSTASTSKSSEGLTKTGDDTNYTPVVVIALVGAVVLIGAVVWRRKK